MLRFSILTIAASVALQLTSQPVKAQFTPGETGPIGNELRLRQDGWIAQAVPGETGPVSPAPSPSPD
jgi:hypothetical protein